MRFVYDWHCVCERLPPVCLSVYPSLRVFVCFSFQCETPRRDGCTMRQSAYTCVNSCLSCPQVPVSELEPADERAGGRLQRLDQLAVSVSLPPVCAGWMCVCVCESVCVCVCVCVCV